MNSKPALVVLAAGMGSRYGGLKQLDAIGPHGDTIIDYSVYDAIRAGFSKVVFIIKKSLEEAFQETVIHKLTPHIEVSCVYQEIDAIPPGFNIPDERKKPWGTAHAVLMAREAVEGPFAVINADDFYGPKAYQKLADYYQNWTPAKKNDYCMVAYEIGKTLSDHGSVSRGICQTDVHGFLTDVVERTKIVRTSEGIAYKDEQDQSVYLPPDTVVSMNFWGFTPSFFGYLDEGFRTFIKSHHHDPKAEYFIPSEVNHLINQGIAQVKVLSCDEQWFGMTYQEDRSTVVEGIRDLIEKGVYPEKLWR